MRAPQKTRTRTHTDVYNSSVKPTSSIIVGLCIRVGSFGLVCNQEKKRVVGGAESDDFRLFYAQAPDDLTVILTEKSLTLRATTRI